MRRFGDALGTWWCGLVVLAACAGGCGPLQTYEGPKLPARDVALLWNAGAEPSIQSIDGKSISLALHGSAELRPGRHVLGMRVRWSNGYAQRAELPVVMSAGGRYVVKQYEGEPSKPPQRPPSIGEGIALEAAAVTVGTVALYTSPFWLPPALVISAVQPKPTAPPEGHGMIVWVEGNTRRSVAEWKSEWGKPAGVALTPTD